MCTVQREKVVWFTVRVLLVRIWLTFSGAKDPEAALLLLAEDGCNDLEQVRPAGRRLSNAVVGSSSSSDAKNLALVRVQPHHRFAAADRRRGGGGGRAGASSRQLSRTIRLRPLSSRTTSKGADLTTEKANCYTYG